MCVGLPALVLAAATAAAAAAAAPPTGTDTAPTIATAATRGPPGPPRTAFLLSAAPLARRPPPDTGRAAPLPPARPALCSRALPVSDEVGGEAARRARAGGIRLRRVACVGTRGRAG